MMGGGGGGGVSASGSTNFSVVCTSVMVTDGFSVVASGFSFTFFGLKVKVSLSSGMNTSEQKS